MPGAEYEVKGLQTRKADIRGSVPGTRKSPCQTHRQTLNITFPHDAAPP